MDSLEQKKQALSAKMSDITQKDEKMKFIILQGKSLAQMPEKFKIDQFLVKGCISKAWLFPQFDGERVHFHADSEAMIVKGIIAVLMKVFNDSTPQEIMAEDGSFLVDLGIEEHLSMNRRNGLANVMKMIHSYAAAFAAQSQEAP